MTKFDDIYGLAADNHGLITSLEARSIGVSNNELVQYARRGSLERVGQGVYRLSRHVPTEADPYAIAVALVGEGAFLYGEAVIALLGLAPTTPGRMRVATARRVRRTLPDYVEVVPVHKGDPVVRYEGVPCQRVDDAIRAERGRMPDDRLAAAARAGRAKGYITRKAFDRLVEDLGGDVG
ncbi:type IV toxin-antitoxin system AbiEi family antitoxin domain-containing protein [Olsenella intestinalis]|uniref:type IV toxin-antitoxin system AbiEi family antitoxin domain-containing protein n=1 Tax=Olsenella intestinalis TaxID=2930083 RepID=UPI00200CDC05|nr:type IV toxin-antitoxin system AbiEi family antitoxin domain-containing protein [Olsenella intestinalis]